MNLKISHDECEYLKLVLLKRSWVVSSAKDDWEGKESEQESIKSLLDKLGFYTPSVITIDKAQL